MDARAQRIAQNEARFRTINERLRDDLRALPDDDELVPFICECGHLECTETVLVAPAEYEAVRSDPLQFVVVPGHEIADVEDVIERNDRYAVVRKHPPTRPIAVATDPRS
jgi:hypothetical protein